MDCYIICDGSFDKGTRLGAMGGSISIGDHTSVAKSEYLTELEDSHDAELHAINLMLEQIKPSEAEKIKSLHIFTDSLYGIGYITGKKTPKKGSHKELLVTTIQDKLDSFNENVAIVLDKVKSHVEHEEASDIEKVHNEIDRMVTTTMKGVRDPIVYPQSFAKDKRSVAMYIDRAYGDRNIDEVIDFIEQLSMKGYYVSIAVEDNRHLEQIGKKIKPQNCSAEIYLNEILQENKVVETTPLYAAGMERAVLRAFMNTKDIEFDAFVRAASDTAVNAAEVAAQALICRDLDFREGLPSFVISFSDKETKETINDVGFWFNSLSNHLNIRTLSNNKAILKALGVQTTILKKSNLSVDKDLWLR